MLLFVHIRGLAPSINNSGSYFTITGNLFCTCRQHVLQDMCIVKHRFHSGSFSRIPSVEKDSKNIASITHTYNHRYHVVLLVYAQ